MAAAGSTGDRQDGEALAAALLAEAASADPAALAARLLAAPAELARAATAALGRAGRPEAGPVLLGLAEGPPETPKELRKAARRALHQLRATGLAVPRPRLAPPPRPTAQVRLEPVEAATSPSDGVGTRAFWLLIRRSVGGAFALSGLLNDQVGLKECEIEETTRRRFDERLARLRAASDQAVVLLPPEYGQRLLGEALELNRASGLTVPADYQLFEHANGRLALPFERALVYDELPAEAVPRTPERLAETVSLLNEPELRGWNFGFDAVVPFTHQRFQARQSQLVLSEQLKAEREERIVSEAVRTVVTEPLRRALQRRLEETAYVFLRTGRPRQAELALAAALQIGEGALTLSPLLRAMMELNMELAGEAEAGRIPLARLRHGPRD